ncbi:MAG: acetoacetate--CoA ligase [Conexivisphaerales archaeon]
MQATNGRPLWEPSDETIEKSSMKRYMNWLESEHKIEFRDYNELWKWSVTRIEDFWSSVWEYFNIKSSQNYDKVLLSRKMTGAKWFVGSRLNYAENVFKNYDAEKEAILFRREDGYSRSMLWRQLKDEVEGFAAGLRKAGVREGDRVAAYLPNIPHAVVAFLATASLGAIWSSCSVDFGVPSALDRFSQIEPKVLVTVDGYIYAGKKYDRTEHVARMVQSLPSLKKVIMIPYANTEVEVKGYEAWDSFIKNREKLSFTQLEFEHPIWILYSSGTTGLPKAIVHSHGGILLEHLKAVLLHNDISSKDRFFWFTSTGWMMWNYLASGLLGNSTILLYDGSPSYPDMNSLWEFAEKSGITFFGTSAAYINSCMKAAISPKQSFNLDKLRGIGSTGSPLSVEGFEWVYRNVKDDVWLASISGGTDMCTAFVGGCNLLPVYPGEIQCRYLGAKVESYDEKGEPRVDSVGELVITEPMPSMPVFFWNDPDGKKYFESYFSFYPGVWRHGDWIKITGKGTCIIYGRSDATIKKMGVRLGSSEIYRAVESLPEVVDSLVVDLEGLGQISYMPLFLVLRPGLDLTDSLKEKVRQKIRVEVSPRFLPDDIFVLDDIPKTLNGKKLEIPVKKILLGEKPEDAINLGSVSNPGSLSQVEEIARKYIRPKLLEGAGAR